MPRLAELHKKKLKCNVFMKYYNNNILKQNPWISMDRILKKIYQKYFYYTENTRLTYNRNVKIIRTVVYILKLFFYYEMFDFGYFLGFFQWSF